MIEWLKRLIGDLIEKIFKRKELQKFKTQASLLEKEVEEQEDELKDRSEVICLLTSGMTMNLTQPERYMIRDAIKYVPFKEAIELPATKAHIRMTWRSLEEKITRSLRKEVNIEAKEDDETKAGDNG